MQITTIGLDLAKNVMQVHGIDTTGKPALRKKLRRAEAMLRVRTHKIVFQQHLPQADILQTTKIIRTQRALA